MKLRSLEFLKMRKQAPVKSGSPGAPVELETGPDEKRAWLTHTGVDSIRRGSRLASAPAIWARLQLYELIPKRTLRPGYKNESGFRPPLCTYRLNWARRTSWGWWDDWDDTVLQTQDSKFEPWRSEAEHATSRSRRLPTILTFTRGWGRNNFVSFKPPRPGAEPRTLAWKAAVLTKTLGPPPCGPAKGFYNFGRTHTSSKWGGERTWG